jgi:hypothetical protein
MNSEFVREATFRELIAAFGESAEVTLVGAVGGFYLSIGTPSGAKRLASSKGDARLFTLPHAARYLRILGLQRFTVDTSAHQAGRIRKARPDRAAAMRKTRTNMQQQPLIG